MTPSLQNFTLLQVIPKLIGGGAERTTLEVGCAVVEAGGRSIVVSSGGGMVEELTAGGSEHITMPVESKNPWLIASNASELAKLIEKEGVSLIHARSRAPAWSCLQAARRTGVPFVTTYHGTYNAKTALKKLYNSVMVRSDAVIANSDFTAANVTAQYADKPYFTAEKMTTIPRGADLSRFEADAVDPAKIDEAWALFGEGFKVILPGRFTGWKGQRVLIDAAALLKERRSDIPLKIICIGRMDEKADYVESLKSAIDAAGLGADVQLLPATDDLPPFLHASDVVVSASTEPEAFGRVAVEAQATGTPVIATAHGGSLETVRDGETGILVPPGDADALASAIERLHDDGEDARRAMGASGINHVRLRYSVAAMTSATLMVYEELKKRWETRGER
ncbi:MAG: glycosyltransferase family 4 protein [Pseudomonadota bacterium]